MRRGWKLHTSIFFEAFNSKCVRSVNILILRPLARMHARVCSGVTAEKKIPAPGPSFEIVYGN